VLPQQEQQEEENKMSSDMESVLDPVKNAGL